MWVAGRSPSNVLGRFGWGAVPEDLPVVHPREVDKWIAPTVTVDHDRMTSVPIACLCHTSERRGRTQAYTQSHGPSTPRHNAALVQLPSLGLTNFKPRKTTSDSSSASGACSLRSVSSQRPKRGTFKRPRLEEGRGPSSNEQEAPALNIPTASRGRGKRKGSEKLVPATQTEPTEADSSEMEVSCGEGSVGQNVGATSEVSLRKAVMEALRMVAGQKSQNARNGVLRHAKATIMKAARQNGAPLAAGRQMTALQNELGEAGRNVLTCWRAGASAPHLQRVKQLQELLQLQRRPVKPLCSRPTAGERAAKAPIGRRRRCTVSQPAVAPTGVEPTPVSDFPVDGGQWHVVGEARRAAKEGRKRRKKEQRQRWQQRRNEKRAATMLVAPKTAAVVITLQPDAVKRGVTYGDVLAKLKAAVTPAEYGAPDGVYYDTQSLTNNNRLAHFLIPSKKILETAQ
ncbi:hypothetical protein SFRURICE_001965 [Spodoptera frugiperda]|nr:hypothetical protein SFRURICE_001965 [Spodoptera frugiperda]